jgi:Fic family protein
VNDKLTIGGKQLREICEAINHDEALKYIEGMIRDGVDMTEKHILDIHTIILNNIDKEYAGRYRDLPVRITGASIVLPNPLKVPTLMKDFAANLCDIEENILVWIARQKYTFLAIHPFIDGNGRASRLIWNYFLLKNGYPIAYIDIADRPTYMHALQQMDI